MKRLINVRLPALFACLFAIGIYTEYRLMSSGISLFFTVYAVIATAVIFILAVIFSDNKFLHTAVPLCGLFLICGIFNCYFRINERAVNAASFFIFGHIRSAIHRALYENLDGDTAAVAFGMLTGDTSGIATETLSAFRAGGIAHIFAVSGLHIGIIYGILNSLLKKLHINTFALAAVCIFCIFFYCGVCGFTPSSVRAAIMCSVCAAAKAVHKKYDGLNALAVATIIILIVKPAYLFSVGFRLSVCAVCGIIFLSKNMLRLFKKLPLLNKTPCAVANIICISLSAQAAALPVLFASFGYISAAGLLLNIIIVPVLSIEFTVLFFSTFISVLLPFAARIILPYTTLPLEATLSFFIDSGFENALIRNFAPNALSAVYYSGLFVLSDKVNLKLFYRLAAVFCVACVFITLLIILK